MNGKVYEKLLFGCSLILDRSSQALEFKNAGVISSWSDYQRAFNSYEEPYDIDDGESLVFEKIPPSDFEMTFDHTVVV